MIKNNKFSVIKKLRNISGCGILECKKVLEKTNNDINSAINFLRNNGKIKIKNISSKSVKEGIISTITKDNLSFFVELNSESDFVSKNNLFFFLTRKIIELIEFYDIKNINKLLYYCKYKINQFSIILRDVIYILSENIVLKKIIKIQTDIKQMKHTYIHNKKFNESGIIMTCIIMTKNMTKDIDKLELSMKKLAMHITALNPINIFPENMDSSILEREEISIRNKITKTFKKEIIIKKNLKKFSYDMSLTEQNFVFDTKKKIKDVYNNIIGYTRIEVGK